MVTRNLIFKCLIAILLTVSSAWAATPEEKAQAKLNSDLAYKAFFGTADEVLMLIEKGASPAAVDKKGAPAIALAALRKPTADHQSIAVIKALLASGADINQRDKEGKTALFYAARVGNLENVKLLLDSGADYYLLDKSGETARNYAYYQKRGDVLQFMDDFVKKKSDAVMQEYQDLYAKKAAEAKARAEENERIRQENEAKRKARAEELLEREKLLTEREKELAKKAAAEAEKIVAEAAKAAAEAAKANDNTKSTSVAETPPVEEKKLPADKHKIEEALYNLSYHSCAYQYWYFVKTVSLKSPLSSKEINNLMLDHKEKADRLVVQFIKEYNADADYVSKVEEPSKQTINDELDSFGSNITRVSQNIGTQEDAEKRCNKIAGDWILYANAPQNHSVNDHEGDSIKPTAQ